MQSIRSTITIAVICSFLLSSTIVHAEAISDKGSAISPKHTPGAGEFVHGQGYGKLLMRILILGSVPIQGIHYMPEGTDLIFALMYAGGQGEFAKLNGITIRRRGQADNIDVDLEDLIADGNPIPKLADGDVITVPFNWRKDVSTILTITSFITAITSLVLSSIALFRK